MVNGDPGCNIIYSAGAGGRPRIEQERTGCELPAVSTPRREELDENGALRDDGGKRVSIEREDRPRGVG